MRTVLRTFVWMFVCVIALLLSPKESWSTPPGRGHSHGGGSYNWRGAVENALRNAQRATSQMRGHSHSHSYTPQRQMPQYRYPQSGHSSPRYVAPRVIQSPRVIESPRVIRNASPRAAYPNAAPTYSPQFAPQNTVVTPRVNVVPNVAAPSAAPPPPAAPMTRVVESFPDSPAPTAASVANQLPQTDTRPRTNPGVSNLVVALPQEDLDRIMQQIGDRDLARLEQARQAVLDGLMDVIGQLPDAAQRSAADRAAIRDAVARGDTATVRNLLGDAANSPAGQELLDRADAIASLNQARDAIAAGRFDATGLANLADAFDRLNSVNAIAQAFQDQLAQIAVDQQLIDWLQGADPGVGELPFADDAVIALIPGLPEGALMPLDNGVVMMGAGDMVDEITLGQGSLMEAAGLPTPIAREAPAPAIARPLSSGMIVLANNTAFAVKYLLNQQPQEMAPNYEQKLEGSTSWTIDFDRGDNYGMASYSLTEGYYSFEITDRGWDLVRKTFETKLDNSSNKFAFHYVVDDQQKTIQPGAIHDLTSSLPPVLRFDNGRGEEQLRRLDSGSYQVAFVDGWKLDIFRSESIRKPTAPQPTLAAATPVAKPMTATASVPTLSATSRAESTTSNSRPVPRRLPSGFKIFPTEQALNDPAVARRLPPMFTLFRSAAEERAR